MNKRLVFIGALCVLLLSGCSRFFLGTPNLLQPVDLPERKGFAGFHRLWRKSVGNGTGAKRLALKPLVIDDRVYSNSTNGWLEAFAVQSGQSLWSVNTGHRITAGVGGDKNLVVVGSENGVISAYAAATGRRLWTYRLSSEIIASPTVAAGLVVVRSLDGQIIAIDAKSGNKIWRQDINVAGLTIRGNARGVLLGQSILFADSRGRISLLSLADGSIIYSAPVVLGKGITRVERIDDLLATPVVVGNTLFISAYRHETLAIDLSNGALLWQSPLSTVLDLYADERYLYVVNKNSIIYALSLRDGHLAWQSKALTGRRISPLSGDADSLVTIDFKGNLIALSRDDGAVLTYTSVGGKGAYIAPQAVDGKWLSYTSDGEISLTEFTIKVQ